MDYTEITIEGNKVTMSAEAFTKIDSKLFDLETQVFQCYEKLIDAKQEASDRWNELYKKLQEVETKMKLAERKLAIYEALQTEGYVVFSYTSTDCDNTTSEGWFKCYSMEQVDGAIEGLYEDAEGSVGYEIITTNLKDFKDESERRTYGGYWY